MVGLVLVFIGIIAYTHSSKPRSVNVALETVLEFNSKDDIKFIDTMQNFLDKLKQTIAKNQAEMRAADDMEVKDTVVVNQEMEETKFKFADFVSNTSSVLKSYNDEDLKRFFRTVDREIKTWSGDNKFFQLPDKVGFRRLVSDTLKKIKDAEANEIRKTLSDVSRKLNNYDKQSSVTNWLNSLYRTDSERKLGDFLNNLKQYRRSARRKDLSLRSIIRSGIQAVIIDPISKLSPETVSGIIALIDKYWTNDSISKAIIKYERKRQESGVDVTEELTLKVPYLEASNAADSKGTKQNEIFDYIEDHKKVIEKHLTTRMHTHRRKKSKKNKRKTITTLEDDVQATKSVKKKHSKSKHDTETKKLRKKSKKHGKKKIQHNTDLSEENRHFEELRVNEPMLIKMESTESEDEDTFSFTSEKPSVKPKRHKKRKTTSRPYSLRTTKKSRKAFVTSTLAHEGLSIEHFGSLFNFKGHRKSNVNDTFTQIAKNITSGTEATTVPTTKALQIERRDELDRENEIYLGETGSNEGYTATEHVYTEDKTEQVTGKSTADPVIVTKRKPNVVTKITKVLLKLGPEKKPITKTTGQLELTTEETKGTIEDSAETNSTYIVDDLVSRNVSTDGKSSRNETKANIPIKLRSNDLNVTDLTATKVATNTVPTTITSITTKVGERKIDGEDFTSITKVKVTETEGVKNDGLEVELENLMRKYNATTTTTAVPTLPAELNEFLKKAANVSNDKAERRMQYQMMADMQKLLAPPTTTTAATEIFTDPFKDIDDELDMF